MTQKLSLYLTVSSIKTQAHYLCECSDWATHGLIGDSDETHGDFLNAHFGFATPGSTVTFGLAETIGAALRLSGQEVVDLLGELPEVAHGLLTGERLVLTGAENAREEGGHEPPKRKVGVSDSKRAT